MSVKPYQLGGKNPCSYCIYHTVCQFNEEIPDNCYEQLEVLSKDEVWEALEHESFKAFREGCKKELKKEEE